jgi:hypothetical protein
VDLYIITHSNIHEVRAGQHDADLRFWKLADAGFKVTMVKIEKASIVKAHTP